MTQYACCRHCVNDAEHGRDDHFASCPVPECGAAIPLKTGRPGDQPLPVPNDEPYIQHLVQIDLIARQQLGALRYGVPGLQPHNGRDMLRDLYEELLDAAVYARAAIYERDNPR
jgi:hypothetical protein